MKVDMSDQNQIVNGGNSYTDSDVYSAFDQRLNIKHSSEQVNGAGDYTSLHKTNLPTREVQVVQNRSKSNVKTEMTIKPILNDKVSELHSFDNNEMESKMKIMEEENSRLRKRNRVLEDRIAFLEKNLNLPGVEQDSLSPHEEKSNEDGHYLSDSMQAESPGMSANNLDMIVPRSPNSDSHSHISSPERTSPVSQTLVPGSPPPQKQAFVIPSSAGEIVNLVQAVMTMASPSDGSSTVTNNPISPQRRESHTPVSLHSPTLRHGEGDTRVPRNIQEAERNMVNHPATHQSKNNNNNNNRDYNLNKFTNGSHIKMELDRPGNDDDDIIVVTPSNATPLNTRVSASSMSEFTMASDEMKKSRPKETPPKRDTPVTSYEAVRNKPREHSVSPHDKFRAPPTRSPEVKPVSMLPKGEYYDAIEGKRVSPREPRDPKVRQYERSLLGELPKSPPGSRREIMDPRRREPADNLMREQGPRVNLEAERMRWAGQKANSFTAEDKYSASAPTFSEFRSVSQMPRSSSESSLYPGNVKRGVPIPSNSNSMVVHRDDNMYNPNDIRTPDGLAQTRDYRHKEAVLLGNDVGKVETLQNPYMNATSMHHVMVREPPNTMQQPMQRINESGEKVVTDLRRYEPGRRRDVMNSPSTSLKPSLKRTQMRPSYQDQRLVEYEPLSKVSANPPPRPPPLIPNPALSPNRYPGRNMNIPRPPVVRPAYSMPVSKYSSPAANYPITTSNYPTSANYNIRATNFHAISRANNYHMPTPNYMNTPANFPPLYENHLNLPQLVAHITSDKSSIIFTWDKVDHTQMYVENVDVYFLFAFHTLDLNQPPPKENSYWKRISIVNALPLPIACTLTQSFDGQNYFFAVAAVNRAGVIGELSNPCALKVAL